MSLIDETLFGELESGEDAIERALAAYREELLKPFEELAQKLADDQDRCSAPSHNIDVAIREIIEKAREP